MNSVPFTIHAWAFSLAWADRHYEEGHPRCTCMLCEEVIGAPEEDPRWKTHDESCAGCRICEIAIRLFRGIGRECQEQRYHEDCFARLIRVGPKLGPAGDC
jgi:hypothetical protein